MDYEVIICDICGGSGVDPSTEDDGCGAPEPCWHCNGVGSWHDYGDDEIWED